MKGIEEHCDDGISNSFETCRGINIVYPEVILSEKSSVNNPFMESSTLATRLSVSGNLNADCTLLITDMFNLFPSSFSKLIPMLETKYRVVSYNDNGFDLFNRTQHTRHQNIEGYADDLLLFLHEKKLENVTYIAHSINAFVAFQAAAKEPDLFEKIILLSATPYLTPNLAALYGYGSVTDADDNLLFDKIIREGIIDDTQQLPALLGRLFSNYSADKSRQIFNILTSADFRARLGEITVPVMILQGAGDKISTSEMAYLMHRHIPESYLIKIRANGHLPQLQAPNEILDAMEIFMHPVVC